MESSQSKKRKVGRKPQTITNQQEIDIQSEDISQQEISEEEVNQEDIEQKYISQEEVTQQKVSEEEKDEFEENTDLILPKLPRPQKPEKEYGILVIDDETPWMPLYKNNLFLNQDGRYKFKFYSANAAIKGARYIAEFYGLIHIVILDLNLPRKNGTFFLETVVDKLGIENLGVFVVTSYGSDEALQKCMLYGARGYYDKDKLNFQTLSQAIYDYLDFVNRYTAIEEGVTIEEREVEITLKKRTKIDNQIYLRWVDPRVTHGNYPYSLIYIGRIDEMETVRLPNLQTDLSTVKNFKKKK